MLYSAKVMDHFMNPRNAGVMEDADGIGEVGSAKCGDIMKIYLKIDGDIISDVSFETFGCGSAIASSSMATEMIKGQPLSRAMALTNQAVAEALKGGRAELVPCAAPEGVPTLPTNLPGTLCVAPDEVYEGFFVAKLRKK